MPQLSVEVPHALTPAQAKARLKEKIDSARDSFGGQVNALQEDWDEQGVSFSFQAVGMRVAAISCITNLAAGMSDTSLSHREVIDQTQEMQPRMRRLLTRGLGAIAARAGSGDSA